MTTSTPDIIEFITSDRYLGPDDSISVPQVAVLKAIYGLEMTPEELEAFLSMTDGRRPRKGGYSTAWIIAGVRSGKTDKILANIACYETFVFEKSILSAGEEAFFPLVAQNIDGANRARSYVEGKLLRLEERNWEILDHGTAQSRAITGKEIRTLMGVTIRCFPCTKAGVRGLTAIGYGTDEVAWWQTEEGGYNADKEVIRALRSRVATIGKAAKRINVTSPYAEEGVVWEAWEKRHTSQELVINVPSWVFNPSLTADFLAGEQQEDPVAYMREYGAQFGKEGGTYFSPDEVDRIVDKGRPLILPPADGVEYHGKIDVGFKHDLYVLGIAHDDSGTVVADLVKTWQGSKKEPLRSDVIAAEASEILRAYRVDTITGDQYWDSQVQRDYAENGITVTIENESEATKFDKFHNLKAIIRRGEMSVPADPIIRKDLLSLRRVKGGKYPKIEAPERKGFHDDVSNVLASLGMKIKPASARVDTTQINRDAMPASHYMESWQRRPEDVSEFGGDILSEEF